MAKKSQIRKNSRASRRLLDVEPELDISDSVPKTNDSMDAKANILTQLATSHERKGSNGRNSIDSELLAISRGDHPDQKITNISGKISKQGKKNKKDRKKQQRAEMIQDMLAEKITLAKKRHKTIKSYRQDNEDDDKS